jgi:hypothetical protein
LLLNVLPDSAEHGRRNGAYDLARVIATDAGNIAHSLRHGIVVLAEHSRQRSGLLWIFSLHPGCTMYDIRTACVCVRRDCGSDQRNRGLDCPLRNDGIDAQPLAHLLNGGVAHLLLDLFLN